MSRIRAELVLAALAATAVAGCRDGPSPTSPALPLAASSSTRDVPSTRVTLPPHPRAFDTNDSALEYEVQHKGGLAVIAFKSPGSPRTFEAAGQRGAISVAQAQAGLAAAQALGAEVLQVYDVSAMAFVRLPQGAATFLRHSPTVDFVEPIPDGMLRGAPIWLPVPGMRQGSANPGQGFVVLGQTTPWGVSMVHAPSAWATTRGASAKVMIMTTGMISNHPDLPSIPVGNCGGLFNACSSQFTNGTTFAGVIAALDNGIGVVGVAPGLPGSNLYSWRFYDDNGAPDWNAYLSGMNAAPQNGIKVVLTDAVYRDYWAAEATAVAAAWSAGTIIVAGVGDEARNYAEIYPASYLNVVGVSGVRDDGTFASSTAGCTQLPGSDYGPMVDLAAPYWAYATGSQINLQPTYFDTRGDLGWCSNALAAAHVVGVIALMRDHYPTWTPNQIVQKLFSTASGGGSRDDYFGFGIPNAQAAVYDAPPPPPLTSYIAGAFPSYYAAVFGGVSPYSYYWEFCISNCGLAAPARGGIGPNRPIQGWQFFSTDQSVSWSTHSSYLLCTVTDSLSQQSQSQIYVP